MNVPQPVRTAAVKPRDAASLVFVDDSGNEPRILMGKRHAKMKFIPDAFVFPGGKLDPHDFDASPATGLNDHPHLKHTAAGKAKTIALAMAAVRETFEETGLLLAEKGDVGTAATGETWAMFRDMKVAPALHHISYVARAITPTNSPVRFHARFFKAPASALSGSLKGSGELEELDWYPLSEALQLPIIDVTEFVLNELKLALKGTHRALPPLYCYLNGKPRVLAPKPR